jgi:hypothetical protein
MMNFHNIPNIFESQSFEFLRPINRYEFCFLKGPPKIPPPPPLFSKGGNGGISADTLLKKEM